MEIMEDGTVMLGPPENDLMDEDLYCVKLGRYLEMPCPLEICPDVDGCPFAVRGTEI